MFKSITAAVVALANAIAAIAHNRLLNLIYENARELYEAKKNLYDLEDGGAGPRALDLARLRLQNLSDFKKRLDARSAATAPAVDAAALIPSAPGTVDKK